jgi:FKBP-type peptidyl-prolyl cis-trans isomerase
LPSKTIPAPADVKAPPKDAKKTSTGLAYKVLTPGTGKKHPMVTSEVTVQYTCDPQLFRSGGFSAFVS